MVGKVSERVLLREGLERTDNGMKTTSWPEVTPINQKNYYTEYMKRDDQVLALRVLNEANRDRLVQSAKDRDRALSQNGTIAEQQQGGDLPLGMPTDGGNDISKVIVIHPGSQFLRIGFSTDVLPKTVPMCLATKFQRTESEEYEARPRRQFEAQKIDQQYGEDWSKKYKKMTEDLKADMRLNKRKVLPNSKELVVNYNRRTDPEVIPTHNDPLQVEWTDVNTPVPIPADEVEVDIEEEVVAPEDEPPVTVEGTVKAGEDGGKPADTEAEAEAQAEPKANTDGDVEMADAEAVTEKPQAESEAAATTEAESKPEGETKPEGEAAEVETKDEIVAKTENDDEPKAENGSVPETEQKNGESNGATNGESNGEANGDGKAQEKVPETAQDNGQEEPAEDVAKAKEPTPPPVKRSIVPKIRRKPMPPTVFYGAEAQRIPDDSSPKFRLRWPMQHGWLNEDDYSSVSSLYSDFEAILTHAIQNELGLKKVSSCRQYSCVFVIPDLYDKAYVETILRMCMDWFEFNKVCFIQESYSATCGAGYSQGCVVDVGAQKTSIACVEDGLVVEDSRINLKYGGFDVTETLTKMLLYDHFPYQEINLQRRYDFLLAEELKQKHCTMNQADISVQLYQFHLRVPNQPTHKYQFKTYDEVILAPMGFYEPTLFDSTTKLRGRRKLIDRTYNAYDVDIPDDPVSAAQVAILALDRPSVLPPTVGGLTASGVAGATAEVSTPSKEKQPFNFFARGIEAAGATPSTSKAPSPAPEGGASTPVPAPFVFGAGKDTVNGAASPAPSGRNGGTPAPNGPGGAAGASQSQPAGSGLLQLDPLFHRTAKDIAIERDSVLPVAPLDIAIMTSIQNAAKGDERKLKDYLGSVMVVGGGAKIPHFTTYLEERLRARRLDLVDKILVSRSARDMDEQVVVWKGASVFAKLTTNDSWITPYEYAYLGPRILHHKVLWQW
ncbi:Actin-like protein arp8 [Sporothrix stenoceras]|uniref:Actin-like protein arp8 n=1 Tax=Sporothrix stenoceras TaxID=5173 RepID=A0ABR3Z0K2_9PEZI